MRKPTLKRKPSKPKRKAVVRRKKAKVFDAWHLFGSMPGIEKEALAELKRMRDEW